MNQVITILMAMVMLLGSFGEVAQSTGPVSFTANIEVAADGDILEAANLDGQVSKETLNGVLSLLNGLEFKIAVNKQIQELNVQLNKKDFFSFVMKKEEDGIRAISSLAPHTEIVISNETLNAVKERMNDFQIDEQSLNKFSDVLKERTEKLLNDFISKYDDVENGKFELFQKEYTEKYKLQTTAKEATLLLTNYMKDVFEDENLSSFVHQLNIKLDTSELEDAYEQFKKQDEEWFPEMNAEYYRNDKDEDCLKINVEKNDLEKAMIAFVREAARKEFYMNINLTTGHTESSNTGTAGLGLLQGVSVSSSSSTSETKTYNMDIHVIADEENGNWAEIAVHTDKGDIMISAYSIPTDPGKDIRVTAVIPSGDKSISISLNGKISNEAPVYNKKEDLNEVQIEDLMKEMNDSGDESKGGKSEKFMNDINSGLNELFKTLQQEAPDLVNALDKQ